MSKCVQHLAHGENAHTRFVNSHNGFMLRYRYFCIYELLRGLAYTFKVSDC